MDKLNSEVIKAGNGDVEAFSQIVKQFKDIALRYAYIIVGDYDLAQDAVQDAFVQAYLSLPSLREPSAFPAWFRAIVSNCARRFIRGKRVPSIPLHEAVEVPSDSPGPAEIVEKKEFTDSVMKAINDLPEHERTVTELFYLSSYSQSEIAEMLKVPLTTVNNRLHSSRTRLRKRADELALWLPSEKQMHSEVELKRPESKEKQMALRYEQTTRKLLRGDLAVTIRQMTRADIPAMRRLDDEITAGLAFSNAQVPPGAESGPGGPWADDQELTEHFNKYESNGNITLLAEDESGRLIGFADLWVTHEPEPFGSSLNIECIDYIWEYYTLGLESVLIQEAEKVARDANLPALDIGTNTSSGHYPTLRNLGMSVFYEFDYVWSKCKPLPQDWKPSYKMLKLKDIDYSGLVRINHWAPTDFDFEHYPGRPDVHEFYVDGLRIVADFWRLWEPGSTKPISCELFAPPEVLTSPQLMNKILRETAFLAGEAGADEIPLPCPCDMIIDPAMVDVIKREFAFAWMRKKLNATR